jgi:hypothetical protein
MHGEQREPRLPLLHGRPEVFGNDVCGQNLRQLRGVDRREDGPARFVAIPGGRDHARGASILDGDLHNR